MRWGIANERERSERHSQTVLARLSSHARTPGKSSACLLLPRPGAGEHLRPADEREPGRGGWAMDEKGIPFPSCLVSCYVLATRSGTVHRPSSSSSVRSHQRGVSFPVSCISSRRSSRCLLVLRIISAPTRLVGRLVLFISSSVSFSSFALRHLPSPSAFAIRPSVFLLCG